MDKQDRGAALWTPGQNACAQAICFYGLAFNCHTFDPCSVPAKPVHVFALSRRDWPHRNKRCAMQESRCSGRVGIAGIDLVSLGGHGTDMTTETLIEDDRWAEAGLPALAHEAAVATLGHLGLAGEVSVMGCDDTRIATLNAAFRGKAVPTNVLSWPSEERAAEEDGGTPVPPDDPELGDIAISYDTCAREAEAAGITMADHTTHLIVHAVLHLLGYDHERDGDATLMEGLETEILGNMGIADPYSTDRRTP